MGLLPRRAVGEEGEAQAVQPSSVVVAPRAYQVDFAPWDDALFEKMKAFYGLRAPITRDSFFIRKDFNALKKSKHKQQGGNKSSAPEKGPPGPSTTYLRVPPPHGQLRDEDRHAGIKAFERHPSKSNEVDYRLTQDAVNIVAPYMSKRKIIATVQDFCNLLGGGLVSFTTLSEGFVAGLNDLSTGTFVCTYTFRDEDMVAGQGALGGKPEEKQRQLAFHLVSFKGSTRAVNVMCHKLDMEKYRHQLSSLGVYRDKIKASNITPAGDTATKPESAAEPAAEQTAEAK